MRKQANKLHPMTSSALRPRSQFVKTTQVGIPVAVSDFEKGFSPIWLVRSIN